MKGLLASSLIVAYRTFRSETIRTRIRRLIIRVEGGPEYSPTIREVLRRYYHVEIGLYTKWPHRLKPAVFHRGTSIGRYCFVADTVRTFTRNHPMDLKSTHGFFYNPQLGLVKGKPMLFNRLNIGHGVTVGHNSIILPPTTEIGHGAIIAPGSVVCSNIPPYSLVSGFPARVTGYRFAKEKIVELIDSRWWDCAPSELSSDSGLGTTELSAMS